MKAYIITGAGVVIGLIGSFVAGYVASDTGWDRIILRVALAFIVLIAGVVIFWFLSREDKPPKSAPQPQVGVQDELEFVLREAEAKLASAKLEAGDRFGNYPVFFVIGPPGSAKTTAVLQSGLEPELLAGQVYQDAKIAPTASANLWYAKGSIFVELGAQLLGDPAVCSGLWRRFEPGKLKSVVRKGAPPPRAVLVCYDVESLLRQPLETNLNDARTMRTRLSEFSRALGISVPVYALFTRLDRAAFFPEYVDGFDDAEATQLFGAALPLRPTKGVYAEVQTGELNQCFQQLFYSLCGKRPELLAREANSEKTPAVYEFPREFRKLRASVVPFLVELCRPSQLAIGPFLRGFYFTGVRPVLVREVAAVMAPRPGSGPALQAEADANATRMFRPQDFAAAQVRPEIGGSETTTRRVPQWVFLKPFFRDVLLADQAARGLSGTSTRTHTLRRALLGAIAVMCMVLSIASIGSFLGNRNLELTALDAARGIDLKDTPGPDLPSLDALKRLESLRESLELLTRYQFEGRPMSLGWGLYVGTDLYPQVHKLYFDRFQQLLLLPRQRAWVADMKKLPSSPGPNDSFDRVYDPLRAYLITTSSHEYSARAFLSPQLSARAEGRKPADHIALARKQFDFYSDELKRKNPFSGESDSVAVKRARDYLRRFDDLERVYHFMFAEANKANAKANFNERFKGSDDEVINNRDVSGAYTKEGWATMQDSMKNIDRYLKGEEWVLGKETQAATEDREKLIRDLRARYSSDFVSQWQDYLRRSLVKKYDPDNAVQKLSIIASSQSPLLQMFWLASQNTAVDAPDIQAPFKALHTVLPPQATLDQLVVPNNTDYMKELAKLAGSLGQALESPLNDSAVNQTLADARAALLFVDQMALGFGSDPNDTVKKLLKAPIDNVVLVLNPAPDLNKKGAGFCREMSQLTSKYPFNPKAKAISKLEDVNAIFRPKEGALWKFYDENLKKLLVLKGSYYEPVAGANVHLDPAFVDFFNRTAAFSEALYPSGSSEPHLVYRLKPIGIEGINSISVEIDGQPLSYSGGEGPAVTLTWPAPGMPAVKTSATPKYLWFEGPDGLWSTFEFFRSANHFDTVGATSHLKWDIQTESNFGRGPRKTNHVGSVSLDLDMGTHPPVFKEGYLSGIGCVATVAK